jgi:hypothetical protein
LGFCRRAVIRERQPKRAHDQQRRGSPKAPEIIGEHKVTPFKWILFSRDATPDRGVSIE